MESLQFDLNGKEYIELNKLLKMLNLVESGGMAKMVIDEGLVEVNDETEFRKRRKLRVKDVILFEGHTVVIQ